MVELDFRDLEGMRLRGLGLGSFGRVWYKMGGYSTSLCIHITTPFYLLQAIDPKSFQLYNTTTSLPQPNQIYQRNFQQSCLLPAAPLLAPLHVLARP